MWPRERKAVLKTREDKRKKKQKGLDGGESGERRGPWPDHTDTLGSLSPCQLCIVVDPERTHSRTHILNYACRRWEHTWPVCVFECVFKCDSLAMRAKGSVDATKKILRPVFVFLAAFMSMSLNLCAHLCVWRGIFTRLLQCAGAQFFFLLGSRSGWDTGVECVPVCRCIISASSPCLHMCVSRLRTISIVEHKRSN